MHGCATGVTGHRQSQCHQAVTTELQGEVLMIQLTTSMKEEKQQQQTSLIHCNPDFESLIKVHTDMLCDLYQCMTLSNKWICVTLCLCGQLAGMPSCLKRSLTLDIMHKIFDKILSVIIMCAMLTSTINLYCFKSLSVILILAEGH